MGIYVGTEYDDRIDGTDENDSIQGLGGDDILDGEFGNDVLRGGGGRDTLYGKDGTDTLYGDADEDILWGSAGTDELWGGDGRDQLFGGNDADTLRGGEGDDFLSGDAGTDFLYGGDGTDSIDSNYDGVIDTFYGEGGDDQMTFTGEDRGYGGAGSDITYINLRAMMTGMAFDFRGVFTRGQRLTVGEGWIEGFERLESARLTQGDDVLRADAIAGRYSGEGGDDRLIGSDLVDTFYGDGGDDKLLGGGGADVLWGYADDDLLDGGVGADTMRGGYGDDTYVIDEVGDVVIEQATTSYGPGGRDTVRSAIDYVLSDLVEGLVLLGGAKRGTGNALDNTITGATKNDRLLGLDGDDVLSGGDGADLLVGSAGYDVLTGGGGTDVFAPVAVRPRLSRVEHDRITDFAAGEDRIDLTGIRTGNGGEWSFVGDAPLTGGSNQLRVTFNGKYVLVEASIDGDADPEIAIRVDRVEVLSAADFIL